MAEARWGEHMLRGMQAANRRIDDFCVQFENHWKWDPPTHYCVGCGEFFGQMEVVQLLCGHQVCYECCTTAGNSTRDKLASTHMQLVDVLGTISIVVCPDCHRPAAVEGVQRTIVVGFRKMVAHVYRTREHLTRSLSTVVEEAYENQRRSLLGHFSSENLLPSDFRGPWSTGDGQALNLTDFRLPNESWCWMEEWSVCKLDSSSDPQGWQYAWNWPGTGILSSTAEWAPANSALMFVRRRVWRRSRLRVNQNDLLRVHGHTGCGTAFASNDPPHVGLGREEVPEGRSIDPTPLRPHSPPPTSVKEGDAAGVLPTMVSKTWASVIPAPPFISNFLAGTMGSAKVPPRPRSTPTPSSSSTHQRSKVNNKSSASVPSGQRVPRPPALFTPPPSPPSSSPPPPVDRQASPPPPPPPPAAAEPPSPIVGQEAPEAAPVQPASPTRKLQRPPSLIPPKADTTVE